MSSPFGPSPAGPLTLLTGKWPSYGIGVDFVLTWGRARSRVSPGSD